MIVVNCHSNGIMMTGHAEYAPPAKTKEVKIKALFVLHGVKYD